MNEEAGLIINSLTQEKKCLIMRNGIRIWLGESEAQKFFAVLEKLSGSTFVKINGIVINTADVIGIFGQDEINDLSLSKGKEGIWECQYGFEHTKGQGCYHQGTLKGRLLEVAAKNCTRGCVRGTITKEIEERGAKFMQQERCECAKEIIDEYNQVLELKGKS